MATVVRIRVLNMVASSWEIQGLGQLSDNIRPSALIILRSWSSYCKPYILPLLLYLWSLQHAASKNRCPSIPMASLLPPPPLFFNSIQLSSASYLFFYLLLF